MEEIAFLIFGIAYFAWGMNNVVQTQREERNFQAAQEREQYARRINEQREFGSLPVSKSLTQQETNQKK
jgi:hypothetical protein